MFILKIQPELISRFRPFGQNEFGRSDLGRRSKPRSNSTLTTSPKVRTRESQRQTQIFRTDIGLVDAMDDPLHRMSKTRKVRKGTRSCWECKRRKVRCSLSSSSDNATTCVACRRRRTPCVGQEFFEDYTPPASVSPVSCLLAPGYMARYSLYR